MDDLISRHDAIGLEYIVKNINGVDYVMLSEVQMKLRKVPSAQPEQQIYEVLTAEEVAKEVSATSLFSYMEWFKVFRRVSKMGYMICRKPE